MDTNAQAMGGMNPQPAKRRKGYWTRMGGKFLILSIAAHLLFLTGAAYFIIQIIVPRKLTFRAGAPSTNPAKQLAEHKMSMAKKAKSMSAPVPAKRAVTTGLAKVALPPMPEMPTNVVMPTQIVGIGGVGIGFGSGQGGNGNGGGGGNGFMAPFGGATARPGTMVGTFYDFKFTRSNQEPPPWDIGKNYVQDITKYAQDGNASVFNKYLRGHQPLYTTQIFFPTIQSEEGPHAFGSPKLKHNNGDLSVGKWIVIYKGDVSPPESGVYHFVGAGDDDMVVRFDNKLILFDCEHISAPDGTLTNRMQSRALGDSTYDYSKQNAYASFVRSLPVTVAAGTSYHIEILIGDDVPQTTFAKLLIEKEGATYNKDGNSPILPIFSLGPTNIAPDDEPAHTEAGPYWKSKASNSLMDMFDDAH